MSESEDQVTQAVGETAEHAEDATGAVGLVVGMLTGGFAIAAAAGLLVGLSIGYVIARRATPPPPRWRVRR